MKGIFAGTFDPPTLGHYEIIQRASYLCERLYVAITEHRKNTALFTLEDKVLFLRKITRELENVEVITFSGLAVDLARKLQADCLFRGLRNGLDFTSEHQMAAANRQMTGVETFFLATSPEYALLSSSLIREIALGGRRLHGFVPEIIEAEIFERLNRQKGR